jgi:hypothetical protein
MKAEQLVENKASDQSGYLQTAPVRTSGTLKRLRLLREFLIITKYDKRNAMGKTANQFILRVH